MPKSRIPSPARSQSAIVTPRRVKPRGPRSVGSPARSNTSVRLTSVIQNFKDKNMDSFHLSPLNSRRSVLNDNTDIEEPKRRSWWKKLNDTSRDIMEVLENDKQEEPYNVMEEFMDVEVLSQDNKNPTLDLPDSSDNESISSIVVPQRRLFSQKENHPHPQKKFAEFLGPRESMAKLNKTSGASDKSEKTIVAGTKKLFGQSSKPRSKPAFPSELLKFSPDKTINKTAGEIKGQVRNLFGNRAGVKRKNNFADFIASESEEEPEIQPKVFGFQKKTDVPSRRVSTASRGNRDHSPTSSVTTDIDMEDWKMLPSSTMVQPQLEAMMIDSPAKKARLSKLSEGKESEAATNSTAITNKTKQSNKSVTSKNKTKMSISKTSINKSRTSPRRNDEENIKGTVINEEIVEQNDQEVENDENEVSLHYSDDDPQEDNLEHMNEHDANNKNMSNKSASSTNKSKMSSSLNKSKTSNSTRKSLRNEANIAEKNDDELIVNKSREKQNSKQEKEIEAEEESPDVQYQSQEIEHEHQNSEVVLENEDQEMEDEIQESEEEENEEQENESHEMDDENLESEVEQEDQQENESQEIEDENEDSEVEQEMEDENQESEIEQEDKEQNSSQKADPEAPVDDNQHNESKRIEVENQDLEVEKLSNGTTNKTELHNQSATSGNKSKRSSLMNKSKTSSKKDVSGNIKATVINKDELDRGDQEVQLDNAGNSPGDVDAEEIGNLEQNNEDDVTNKTKHANESFVSKNKSKLSISKNIINKTNKSPNKSLTSISLNKSTSKSFLSNKSKTSPRRSKNENVADEDQIDAESAIMNNSQEIDGQPNNENVVNITAKNGFELGTEQDENPENQSHETEDQNHLSKVGEEEQEIEENKSQEIVNESEQVEEDDGNEEDEENNDDEHNESEDAVNESQEVDDLSQEIENESQEVEESQEIGNESQEVENNESEDEEAEQSDIAQENDEAEESEVEEENERAEESEIEEENEESEVEEENEQAGVSEIEEAEESKIEEENKSQEEMEEDIDQHESNESMEESDGQNDAENDENHGSQEEIRGTDEGTPNVTHDTTGRNRKKNETNLKSPEAILHDNTNQIESFTAKGRNTSIRRTSMIKSLNIRPSLAPPRESTGFSDGSKNSSAEGSGWDSHRVTKKTLRQTFGRDFTPRKSLRALVMEKSAKRHTEFTMNEVDMPRANSTELPEDTRYEMEVDPHEVSKRTRQTTLEMYLQKIKKQNMEKRMKMEEEVRNSLKAPSRDTNPLTMPSRPFALKRAKPVQTKSKTKAVKSMIPLDDLPQELIEDMKYKPPRRFQPSNASWITKRLYKFLESKLEAKYDYKARIRAEKLVETIYNFTKDLRRHKVAPSDAVEELKHEMARLDVVRTHFDFYQFFHDYMPREVRVKVNPDVVNKIPLPRQGVFTDILRGNTVQG